MRKHKYMWILKKVTLTLCLLIAGTILTMADTHIYIQRPLHELIGYRDDLRRTGTGSFPDDGSAVVLQPGDSYILILKLTI